VMKRILRLVWVFAANCFVGLFTVTRLSAALSSRESRDLEVWIEIGWLKQYGGGRTLSSAFC
jgi:hypothetical protein